MNRESRVDQTELEREGERQRPEGSVRICPECDAPRIEGECEC